MCWAALVGKAWLGFQSYLEFSVSLKSSAASRCPSGEADLKLLLKAETTVALFLWVSFKQNLQ